MGNVFVLHHIEIATKSEIMQVDKKMPHFFFCYNMIQSKICTERRGHRDKKHQP